ncbi:malonate--CoA ligase [Novispirillum itersonii]|uniref:malonate--CoA ligase n=1 Tax=Novispirillum itersonii TaxID=189 RepID=UPI0003661956|nr:malonyl-CoA synthase [Novispirillum itersonii]
MTASLYAKMYAHFPPSEGAVLLQAPGGRTITYGMAHEWSGRYAHFMSSLGLQKGDRVAVQTEKSPEALLVYLACLRGGFVFLPMNTAYRPDEVDYLVSNAEPALILCSPDAEDTTRTIAARHGVEHVYTLGTRNDGSFPNAAADASPQFPIVACEPDDLAAMLYTSGTTGKPKGAMLTHRNLASNAEALVKTWRFSSDDVLLHALPIFHAHGLFVACHCVLMSGARMIWLSKFDADEVIRLMPQATAFMGVPTFYTRLLSKADFGREATAHMRLFTSGSAPLLAETHTQFSSRTGHAILERYGMTETGMNTGNPYDAERRPGTVGFPFPGVSVRVVGEDDVTALPTGSVGAIQVKGDNVMLGYWRMPEKTKEEFTSDGWFKTGDVGKIDAEGYLHIVGRAKDLIISGGYNVYPKEVEGVIDDLPGVDESAVVGVQHPDFGEVGVAVVKLLPKANGVGEDAILAHLKQHLANYKVPKRVFFTDELPRNTMGKVQKNLLRDQYKDLFRLPS